MYRMGIVTKDGRCVIEEGTNTRWENLLKKAGLSPAEYHKCLRLEAVPPENKWWEAAWGINVVEYPDRDFKVEDRYFDNFLEAIKEWQRKHVFVGMDLNEISEGYYLLKDCSVASLSGNAQVELNNTVVMRMDERAEVLKMTGISEIETMSGRSRVISMSNDSVITDMKGYSVVEEMKNSSGIRKMYDHAVVEKMTDHTIIASMSDNSRIERMEQNSRIGEMSGCAMIDTMQENSSVGVMQTSSMIRTMFDDSAVYNMRWQSVIGKMYDDCKVAGMEESALIIDSKRRCVYTNPECGKAWKVLDTWKNENKNSNR